MAKNKEILIEGKLNEVIFTEHRRPNGSLRVQQDFQFCPSLTDQSQAHMTDINALMRKYKPDEIAAYIAARTGYREEILGHDFHLEPSLQDAKQVVYEAKKIFENLSDDIRSQFRSTVDFIKFIDNPANAEKMLKLGILTPLQVENLSKETALSPKAEDARKKDDNKTP